MTQTHFLIDANGHSWVSLPLHEETCHALAELADDLEQARHRISCLEEKVRNQRAELRRALERHP